MTAKQYANGQYNDPTWRRIAEDAFNAGLSENKNVGVELKLRQQLRDAKSEIKELIQILHDPEKLADWIAGS